MCTIFCLIIWYLHWVSWCSIYYSHFPVSARKNVKLLIRSTVILPYDHSPFSQFLFLISNWCHIKRLTRINASQNFIFSTWIWEQSGKKVTKDSHVHTLTYFISVKRIILWIWEANIWNPFTSAVSIIKNRVSSKVSTLCL